jgi:chromosome segregation ATPase
MLDDDEPRSDSLGRLGWYALGQQHERYRRDNDAFIDRITGQGPLSRSELDAVSAENARLTNYTNQLVQQVNELNRANGVLQEDYRRLREWANQAEAELAKHKRATRDLTDETIDQNSQIVRLNERIEELETELVVIKAGAIRTA